MHLFTTLLYSAPKNPKGTNPIDLHRNHINDVTIL